MKNKISHIIDIHPYYPLIVFAVLPAILLILFYLIPKISLIIAIIGIIFFIGFIFFLLLFRAEDRAALGSAGPAIAGPALAHLFVVNRAQHLLPVLENGGDQLVQLAFFFASLLGLIVYVFIQIGNQRNIHIIRIGFIIVIILLFLIVFLDPIPKAIATGPTILYDIKGPSITPLTFGRFLLALWSIIVACMPATTHVSGHTEKTPL